jgi:diguanylate cyclase (GGDEF)-like protein
MSITTLAPDALSFFLMRYRRGETLERYEPRLDDFLRDVLCKSNEFVPSESGAILLDDPQAKMFSKAPNALTLVTAFGTRVEPLCGQRVSCERGVAGRVYQSGRAARATAAELEWTIDGELDGRAGAALRSLLGVPVVLGNAVCGVLLLVNRLERDGFSPEDETLITIFAGYISSSIQNMLDGLRARELARRDDLTGLFNDRYLHFRLREEIGRCDAANGDLALVFVDLDRFKDINDSCGHIEGSRALREVGLLIEREVPTEAVAARYGGDEFVVILPRADVAAASAFATRLLDRIRGTPFMAGKLSGSGEVGRTITASAGVATLRAHVAPEGTCAHRANSLIRMADTAMYRAKSEGRNRLVVAQYKTKEYPVAAPSRREPANAPACRTAQPGGGPDPGPAVDLPGASSPLRDGTSRRRAR